MSLSVGAEKPWERSQWGRSCLIRDGRPSPRARSVPGRPGLVRPQAARPHIPVLPPAVWTLDKNWGIFQKGMPGRSKWGRGRAPRAGLVWVLQARGTHPPSTQGPQLCSHSSPTPLRLFSRRGGLEVRKRGLLSQWETQVTHPTVGQTLGTSGHRDLSPSQLATRGQCTLGAQTP